MWCLLCFVGTKAEMEILDQHFDASDMDPELQDADCVATKPPPKTCTA